jgi:hypothetical protein
MVKILVSSISSIFIVIFYGLDHHLISFQDQSTHIFAVLAVVDLAGVTACLIKEISTSANRADLQHCFTFHNGVKGGIRVQSNAVKKTSSALRR